MSFKLQMNTFFCNNNVCCCWLGCDDSLLFFGLCQSHETHTYIPYQSFFMNWTYPKFKFFFFGVTVEKICPKNGDSMQIFNLRLIQNDGSTIVLCKHQKTLLLQLLTWFFVLKLLEHTSAHKSHVILFNLQGSEPSFEWYSLTASCFYTEFCVIHFYFDIHFCQNYNWRFVYNIRVNIH